MSEKMVPREPTPEMFHAVAESYHRWELEEVWCAMYDAAPAQTIMEAGCEVACSDPVYPDASPAPISADVEEKLRCERTRNPCGTDTWGNGETCPCDSCQCWLALRSQAADIAALSANIRTQDILIGALRDETTMQRKLGVHLSHCNQGEYEGECKYGNNDCLALSESWSWFGDELKRRDIEIAALRTRLEVSPDHPYDGIACRDETIRQQDILIAELRAATCKASLLDRDTLLSEDMSLEAINPEDGPITRGHPQLRQMIEIICVRAADEKTRAEQAEAALDECQQRNINLHAELAACRESVEKRDAEPLMGDDLDAETDAAIAKRAKQ